MPWLRVLHLGVTTSRFADLVTPIPLTGDTWRAQLRAGADLVLIEPPVAAPGWDPLDGELATLLTAARQLGLPTVRIHFDRWDPSAPGEATLELIEGPPSGASVDQHLLPSVSMAAFHPRGWTRTPPDGITVALARAPSGSAGRLLDELDPAPTLLHPRDLPRLVDEPRRCRSVATEDRLGRELRRAGVLLDHAGWRHGEADRWRSWIQALACGTPVITVTDPAAQQRSGADGPTGQQPPGSSSGGATGTPPNGLTGTPLNGLTGTPPGVLTGTPPGVLSVPSDEVADTVHRLLVDPDQRERLSIAGRRWALTTASRRAALERILDHLDIPGPDPLTVTVLLATHRPAQLEHALAGIAAQRGVNLEVCLVLHGPGFDGWDARDAAVVRAPAHWTLGACLNAGLSHAGGRLVAKFDDDDHYGPDHLADLVVAWRHSGADVVGKRIEFVHLAERDLTLRRTPSQPERDRVHVGGPTLLASRETLRSVGFLNVPRRVDSTLYERVLAGGGRVYGTHSRDVVLARHGSGHGHAWAVDDEVLLEDAVVQRPGLDLGLASSDPAVGG